MRAILSLFALVLALCACTSSSPPGPAGAGCASAPKPAPIPVTPATVQATCSHLAALGCAEGDARCVPEMTREAAAGITILPLACWSAASTKEAVRACGQLACP